MNLIEHYRKVLFFGLHLLEDDNVQGMREHYAHLVFDELLEFKSLNQKKILDVGGATGTFCKVFYEKFRGCAVNLDPNPANPHRKTSGELAICDLAQIWPDTVRGVADNLPFIDNEFDCVFCRSVLEHVPTNAQQSSINELYRVTKSTGLCYIAIPPWYTPWAGHDLRPFHVFPFKIARKLKLLFFRKTQMNHGAAKSYAEMALYPVTFRKTSQMIAQSGFRLVAVLDTHFRLHFLAKVPIIREIAIPLVAFIAEKPLNQSPP